MSKYLRLVIVSVLTALVGTALLTSCGSQDTTANRPPVPESTPQTKIPANVVVTLEEFGDYQCPPCAELHPTLKNLKQEFGANLNFVFRNLPLESIHKNALAAAQAAEAARMQNRFWEMHDLLYENQNLWKDETDPKPKFWKFAHDLGLDTERFSRDLNAEQVQFRIEADKDAALRLGIDGTPTILINGRRLKTEATTPEGIREGIEVMLSRGSAQAN